MKQVTLRSEIVLNGHTLPINTNAQLGHGCYLEILEKTYGQLNAMLSHHGKVFVFLVMFHVNDYMETNAEFSRFMRKLKKRLVVIYGFKRIGYVWVREGPKNEAQHYHLALFLDGDKIQAPHKLFELCVHIWEGWNQPRPSFPSKRCYYRLKRGDDKTLLAAFKHLSYFAKNRTKGNRPASTNDYYTSRLSVRDIQ